MPVGHKQYFAQAEERVEGPIQAACLVYGVPAPRATLLVLTTDVLRVFTLGHGTGWRGRFRDVIDTELMHVPFGAIEHLDRRRSIYPS